MLLLGLTKYSPSNVQFQSYELNDYEVYNDTVYFEVGSLHPVSNYRVDIKTQLRGRERFSNNAFSVFKTASKTLSTNPVTCPDCYALLPENKDKIVIYWQVNTLCRSIVLAFCFNHLFFM